MGFAPFDWTFCNPYRYFFLNFRYMGTYVYANGTAHTDKHTLTARDMGYGKNRFS